MSAKSVSVRLVEAGGRMKCFLSTNRDEMCQLHLQMGLISPPPFVPPRFATLMPLQSSQWEYVNWKGWLIISWIFIIQLLLKSEHFYCICYFLPSRAQMASCAASRTTQILYLQIQPHLELINSVSPPTSPISFMHTDTHAHKVFCNLHAPIWENHTSEEGGGWIRLPWIAVAWKAYR